MYFEGIWYLFYLMYKYFVIPAIIIYIACWLLCRIICGPSEKNSEPNRYTFITSLWDWKYGDVEVWRDEFGGNIEGNTVPAYYGVTKKGGYVFVQWINDNWLVFHSGQEPD